MAKFTAQNQYEKEFFTIFESLCYTRDALLDFLIAEKFPNLKTLQKYCKSFGSDSEDCWFYVKGEKCNYAIRLIPMENNYNLYLYQYAKEI